jgi:hypothetical protein
MADTRVCHTPTDITRPARVTLCGARVVRLVVRRTRSRPLTRMRALDFVKRALMPGTPTVACRAVPVSSHEVPRIPREMEPRFAKRVWTETGPQRRSCIAFAHGCISSNKG